MTTTKARDGGPAYPVPAGNFSGGESWSSEEGMSLRDHFAGLALQGLLAEEAHPQGAGYGAGDRDRAVWFAARAYELADAMLAVREQ